MARNGPVDFSEQSMGIIVLRVRLLCSHAAEVCCVLRFDRKNDLRGLEIHTFFTVPSLAIFGGIKYNNLIKRNSAYFRPKERMVEQWN